MDQPIVSEQAADEAGDVQTSVTEGHSVSVIPAEADATTTNEDAKEWRKSDKDWQEMKELAKKGETAATQLEKLKSALGLEEKKGDDKEVDVVKVLSQKIEDLEFKAQKAEWEKSHPSVDTADYRDEWKEIIKKKGHLVKSGDLSYDDLWSIIRKESKPSTSRRDLKEQELNIGSVAPASKTTVTGAEIDPDVYAVMRKAGYSDEQIRLSAN
jgi:hypothetical protein